MGKYCIESNSCQTVSLSNNMSNSNLRPGTCCYLCFSLSSMPYLYFKECKCLCVFFLYLNPRFSNLHWDSVYCMSVLPSVRKTMRHKSKGCIGFSLFYLSFYGS